ncbi:zinc finger protein 572-like [Rhineura floridana]|uniref:zinc finger protein 572-like n=1 Tax=Rhineura floridana TaxID=261503 RepID=UPI002AC837CE|nr:zinc finger protein 572-like [Rhineura floridana]
MDSLCIPIDDQRRWEKERHQLENLGEAELHWMLLGSKEQMVSHPADQGEAPESWQGNCPWKEENRPLPSQEDEGPKESIVQKIILKDERENTRKDIFTWEHELMLQEATHARVKLYKCLDHRNSFTCRAQRVRHQRIHTGEKPFKCSDCGKSFNCSSQLIMHKRKHTRQKPCIHTDCGQSFSKRL